MYAIALRIIGAALLVTLILLFVRGITGDPNILLGSGPVDWAIVGLVGVTLMILGSALQKLEGHH